MSTILGIAMAIVLFTIGLGVVLYRCSGNIQGRKIRNIIRASMISYMFLIALFL